MTVAAKKSGDGRGAHHVPRCEHGACSRNSRTASTRADQRVRVARAEFESTSSPSRSIPWVRGVATLKRMPVRTDAGVDDVISRKRDMVHG